MNGRLAESAEVKRLCAALARDYRVMFLLADGPAGQDVVWRMEVARGQGVRIALGAAPLPADITVRSDYRAMVRASQSARAGGQPQNTAAIDGDPDAIAQVAHVLAVARATATVDVEFSV